MEAAITTLLGAAQRGGYAVAGFNVYNLEGATAVVAAAEAARAPVIVQLHPAAVSYGGAPLVALCQAAAQRATVPVALHLDHAPNLEAIDAALALGVRSVMADGSDLDLAANQRFTAAVVARAAPLGAAVEAEIGKLSGTEDGLSVAEFEARLTDPAAAAAFIAATDATSLAVSIGNVHGPYRRPPALDWERLAAIRAAVSVPLVLHGASGLPDDQVRRAISLGVCKFNVNTELRDAYLGAVGGHTDLVALLRAVTAAMQRVAAAKIALFGSAGQAVG